jgi:hypothetical protein
VLCNLFSYILIYQSIPEIVNHFLGITWNIALRVYGEIHRKGVSGRIHSISRSFSGRRVPNWLTFESRLPFDQVILEFGAWVHVSFSRSSRAPPLDTEEAPRTALRTRDRADTGLRPSGQLPPRPSRPCGCRKVAPVLVSSNRPSIEQREWDRVLGLQADRTPYDQS